MHHPVREIDNARTGAKGSSGASEAPTRRFGGTPIELAREHKPMGTEMGVETQRPLGLT